MQASLIPLADVAAMLGVSPKTIKNRISEGRFPLKSARIGMRRFVRSDDLASYIDQIIPPSIPPAEVAEPEVQKRGPGRPRKVSASL